MIKVFRGAKVFNVKKNSPFGGCEDKLESFFFWLFFPRYYIIVVLSQSIARRSSVS